MKRKFTLLTLIIGMAMGSMHAQTTTLSIGEFDPYFTEYFRPFARGMASGMGSGWTTTAEVHKSLGFDITINAAIVIIPSSAAGFNSADISGMAADGYTFSGSEFPNVRSSSDDPTPMISKTLSAPGISEDVDFEAIPGLGAAFAGSASLQLGVGLPKGTEVMVRFFPDVSPVANAALSGADIELLKTTYWGLGVKHDIKQWIPVISKVPFLQISGMFTYSKFGTGFKGDDMTFDPERFAPTVAGVPAVTDLTDASYNNQQFEMDISSITGGLLVGASFPVFQPFVGVGFNRGKFDAGLMGTYPILELNTDPVGNGTISPFVVNETENDPLVVDDKKTQFNIQAGARLKLGPVVFHYQFTKQEYAIHSGGLAISIR